MPRFGLRFLLIAFTLVALWFSTLTAYPGVDDVRAFVLTAIVLMPCVAAYAYSGRRKAFWLGFSGTLLLMGTRQMFATFGAKFSWAQRVSMDLAAFVEVDPPMRGQFVLGVFWTLIFGTTIIASALIGWLCMLVYDHAVRESKSHDEAS